MAYTGGKITEVEIGGNIFYIRQFDPFQALKVLGELQKLITPILGGVAGAISKNGVDKDITDIRIVAAALQDVFNALPDQLDGEKLHALSKKLLNAEFIGVMIDGEGQPVKLSTDRINDVFTGNPYDMLRLMFEVAKANYADFSMLSNIPLGLRGAFGEIKSKFLENLRKTSAPKSASGAQLTVE